MHFRFVVTALLEIVFSHCSSQTQHQRKYQHRTNCNICIVYIASEIFFWSRTDSYYSVCGRCNNSIHSNRSTRRSSNSIICRLQQTNSHLLVWFGCSFLLPLLNNLKSISRKSNLLIYNALRQEENDLWKLKSFTQRSNQLNVSVDSFLFCIFSLVVCSLNISFYSTDLFGA